MTIALLVCASFAFADAPKKESQVPAYPGAKVTVEKQSPTKAELASGKAVDWMFALERTWSSTASVEQVAQFYAAKLGVSLGEEGGADPADLGPGEVSSVGSSVDYFDTGWIEESPDAVQKAFAKRAKLQDSEDWARGVEFHWAFKDTNKDPYSFSLTITDMSIPDEDAPVYKQATGITLAVRMINQEKLQAEQVALQAAQQPSAADAKAAAAAQQAQADKAKAVADSVDAETKRVVAFYAKAPSERELGVPINPGARYNAEQSLRYSGFSTDRVRNYVFEVDVTMEELVKYYEKKTGHARIASEYTALVLVPMTFGTPAQKGDNPPVIDSITFNGSGGNSAFIISKAPAGTTGNEGAGR
jgi:hypothetical protein